MNTFPQDLQEAIIQAKEATQKAIADGNYRVQVEFVLPEIALQAQSLALEFANLFIENGSSVKVMFPDTGAAMLAKRDWGEIPFAVTDLGSRFTPVETQIADTDEVFIVACPSSVEVERVEKLCNLAGDRPVVLLIPQLEDVAVVGIGLAARKLRDRFISTLYSSYYIRPLDKAYLLRTHPFPWQIWLEKDEQHELAMELSNKPIGEELERILFQLTTSESADNSVNSNQPKPKKPGIFNGLQQFLKALSQ
jgi:hypothetical protein